MRIAEGGLANVVLIDVVENFARAKAYDLEDARFSLKKDTRIEGSGDMSLLEGSSVVVVTAGLPRKPGMTREDLLLKNAAIVENVCRGIRDYAKEAVVIVVSNPLDVMTYLSFKKTGLPRSKVFGMGASLDTSRFANLISKKLFVGIEHIEALVIGSHGETMLPMPRLTKVRSKPLTVILMEAEVDSLVNKTKQRGADIISLYGSGSAYYAPSAAIFELVDSIISNHHKEIPVSAVLDGEYGLHDVSIGVPARIGSEGIEQIVEIDLLPEEKEAFVQSAQSIKDSIKILNP